MNTTGEIISILIAAITGGALSQLINAKRANVEIRNVKHDIEKKILVHHKNEIEYLTQQVEKYKQVVEEMKLQINHLEMELQRLQKNATAQTKTASKKLKTPM